MKKVPKSHMDLFTMFLTVIGFKAKMNADGSLICLNPRMPKGRRQLVLWRYGKMNKSCRLLWLDFMNHWLVLGKKFIESLNNKIEATNDQ